MNRGRGIFTDKSEQRRVARTATRCRWAGNHLECTCSPRAYSGTVRSRISSGQLAHSAGPWPLSCAEQEEQKRSATCFTRAAIRSSPARVPSRRAREPELRAS